jgi:hypothetical protein
MSTAMLERVDRDTETSSGNEDDLDHMICHCDLTKGWCGAEVEISIGEIGELSGNDCEECEVLALMFLFSCPRGCNCTEDMRMLHCAITEEDDE